MRPVPRSTYRLQVRASFTLQDAADLVDYLRDLGADWAYLSPILRATSGSDHGYDVVDPTVIDPDRGGPEGLQRFADAARSADLGILIDIVPNHMGISKPHENAWWWDVLERGRDSLHAEAFDIDWEFGGGRVTVPILGDELDAVLERGEITVDAGAGLLRYFDHALPLAPGSLEGDADPRSVLDRQHYSLTFWRREASELAYRRFFAVTTLAGVRVELPPVFAATHREISRWFEERLADGLRVDHPDGLVDPGGYLDDLAALTGGAYVLVEKILEHGETLPSWWRTDGTTGYDAMGELDRVLIDPAGESGLDALDAALREDSSADAPASWSDLIHGTKRMIADSIQVSEVRRLVRELPETVEGAEDALAEILACFPVYRSYLPAGREHLDHAVREAIERRPDLSDAITALAPVLADASLPVARRFQQTTGPVMAKGVEDTAFYRYTRLGSLTEVGGDPSVFALPVEGFHEAQAARQASWPLAMTALSTHDTKRGEDVRARLDVLSEIPGEWAETLGALRAGASTGHGPFDALVYQAAIGAWPVSRERLHAYVQKASREAAESTGWWDQDEAFETAMHRVVDAMFDDPAQRTLIEGFVERLTAPGRSNSLTAKLLQIAGPGVPDVYQGSELWEQSLVDPDNRRPVDFAERRRLLAALDAGEPPAIDASGAAKLLVTSRALHARRDRAELFTRYTPVTVVGEAAGHAVAFDRGGALAIGTRLPVGLAARGGWGDTVLLRPAVAAVDALTGRRFEAGELRLAEVLADYPVALLLAE